MIDFESYSRFVLRNINKVLIIDQTPSLLASQHLQSEHMRLTVAVYAFAYVFIPLVVKSGLIDDGSSLRPVSC